jgi:hypothetical protein
MFLLWCGDVLPKVYIFVPRLVSGTGRGFGSAPQQKHTRYPQCRADRVHHTLAHLLAAHSNATPKQAKEPIFATRILGNLTTINLNNDKYHFGQFVGLGHSHKNQ